ncbi:uncharacterized protein LOC136026808 [Artemia franciscana]|uniref:uncharacterized protein LOC136026808 n=1 Tax=Artemia franciscana TaxID=6661 RepID=UPI0032DA5B65
MEYVLRQSTGYGINVNSRQLADLDIADDIVLLEDAKDQLQLLFGEISEKVREVGLLINVDKSKGWSTSGSPQALQCSDKTVEQVQEFKYLGSWMENTGDVKFKINRGIGQASVRLQQTNTNLEK